MRKDNGLEKGTRGHVNIVGNVKKYAVRAKFAF